MSEVRNTTIEENFPAIRRKKSNPTLDGLIKHTITDAFLTLVEGDRNHHRPSLSDSEEAIAHHFRRINSIIDTVDEHIARRLQNHENEVFSLVKGQIEEMRAQTQKIVQKLNEAIAQKNTEDEIWKLSNQLDYFKTQTFDLFSQNKKAKEDNNNLRKTLKELHIQLENNDLLMQKLKKKYMRENFIKDRLAAYVKEKVRAQRIQEITVEQIDDILKLQKPNTRPRFKTQVSNDTSSKFFQSKVNVQLNSNSVHDNYQPNKFTFNEDPDKITEKFSIPSSFPEENEAQLPPVRFVRVESFFTEEVERPKSILHLKKVDQAIQTEDIRTTGETHRHPPVKQFSNTSYIDMPRDAPNKKLDLYKSGFFVRSYNDKAEGAKVMEEKAVRREATQSRYMSKALNKSKMIGSKAEVRGSINKFSMK